MSGSISNFQTAQAPSGDFSKVWGVDPKYVVTLTVSGEGGANDTFQTSVEETLAINLGSQWAAPFENVMQEAAGAAAAKSSVVGKALAAGSLASKGMGLSGRHKLTSVLVWQSSDPFQITVPFTFIAVTSAKKDVLDKVKSLLKMVAPGEAAGMLIAPGPTILGSVFGGVKISLRIGEYIFLERCIVDDVQVQFDNMIGVEGIPLKAKVTGRIKSWYNAFTKQDIDELFTK
jgi:hypothetical protein